MKRLNMWVVHNLGTSIVFMNFVNTVSLPIVTQCDGVGLKHKRSESNYNSKIEMTLKDFKFCQTTKPLAADHSVPPD